MVKYKMNIICCVCGVKYGEKECVKKQDGKDSHGYCAECEKVVREKVKREVEGFNK